MLATAISLAEATKKAIYDEEILSLAGELHTRRNELTDNQFPKYIYMYSVALASKVADLTTKVLLTEKEMSDLVDSISEMENLSETILEELEDAYYEDDYDKMIVLPEGVLWKGRDQAPASAIIEAHHLEAWLPETDY